MKRTWEEYIFCVKDAPPGITSLSQHHFHAIVAAATSELGEAIDGRFTTFNTIVEGMKSLWGERAVEEGFSNATLAQSTAIAFALGIKIGQMSERGIWQNIVSDHDRRYPQNPTDYCLGCLFIGNSHLLITPGVLQKTRQLFQETPDLMSSDRLNHLESLAPRITVLLDEMSSKQEAKYLRGKYVGNATKSATKTL